MTKNICFIYTESNGPHTTEEDVSKKLLFAFARLIRINYEIGYVKNNKFISTKIVNCIIKPRCMNILYGEITMETAYKEGVEIELVLNNFIKDLTNVQVIISHDIQNHLRTIMAEYVRYNIPFAFSKFIIIDNISFRHDLKNPNIETLYNSLLKNKIDNKLEMIKESFLILYQSNKCK